MGFKIIKDNVHTKPEEKPWDKKGYTTKSYKGGQYRFRLLDDDNNIYFYGLSDSDSSFSALDNFGSAWGCTEIQYKENGKYETL